MSHQIKITAQQKGENRH